jgi:hypothetical protein
MKHYYVSVDFGGMAFQIDAETRKEAMQQALDKADEYVKEFKNIVKEDSQFWPRVTEVNGDPIEQPFMIHDKNYLVREELPE